MRTLTPVPELLVPQFFTQHDLRFVVDVRAHHVLFRDLHELLLRETHVLEEDAQAGRALAVVTGDQPRGLVDRESTVPQVDGGEMIRPTITTLDEAQIVAHSLHGTLDLFVPVAIGHALHIVLLPPDLAFDDLDVALHVPRNEAAETHGPAADASQLRHARVGERLEVLLGDGAIQHSNYVFSGNAQVDEAIEAALIDLL